MYPSISNGCLKDGGNVIATAISVAGPAQIPAPGPVAGQTAYVFTAVGTPAPAAEQKLPLNVTWVNLTTGKSGSATLKPRPDINPEGPDDAVRDRRHRLGQHHLDDLRPGHHGRAAVPVHADHRLDGRALASPPSRVTVLYATRRKDMEAHVAGSVGHEEDGVPVVVAAGVLLGQVGLGLLDQIVLVLAGDRLAAGAVQVGLHIIRIA